MSEPKAEEVLEYIWATEEVSGKAAINDVGKRFGTGCEQALLQKMSDERLVNFDGNSVTLTDFGRNQAELIIRRHRIAERLLHDVLDFTSDEYESGACQFEHFVGDDVVASICTMLGHPVTCPHGRVIPRGECCIKSHKNLKSLIVPLTEMDSGEECKVVYTKTGLHGGHGSMPGAGITPGVSVRIHQTLPTIVVQVDGSQVALDDDLARDIYVRRSHR